MSAARTLSGLVGILLLGALLAACSDDDRDSQADNGSLSGKYRMVELSAMSGSNQARFATADFSGTGAYTSQGVYSESGVGASIAYNDPVRRPYLVEPDGSFTRRDAALNLYRGVLSTHYNYFLYSNVDTAGMQSIGFAIKEGGTGFTDASLAGPFQLVELTLGSTSNATTVATITFDAAGKYTAAGTRSDSLGGSTSFSDSGDYHVNSDGTFTMTTGGLLHLRGVLAARGDLFAYVNVDSSDRQSIGLGVQPWAAGHGNANLNGNYRLADLTLDGSSNSSLFATLACNGSGTLTLGGQQSDSLAGIDTNLSLAGSYSVSSDGVLAITLPGPTTLNGAVTAPIYPPPTSDLLIYGNASDPAVQGIGFALKR